ASSPSCRHPIQHTSCDKLPPVRIILTTRAAVPPSRSPPPCSRAARVVRVKTAHDVRIAESESVKFSFPRKEHYRRANGSCLARPAHEKQPEPGLTQNKSTAQNTST
ncbi:unnamed protein product, partial [Ectocarpus sp. 6 AP-2014]